MRNSNPHSAQAGFTLVELAIVLLIVTLLLGGLLPTVSSQIEQQHRNDTRKQIEEIRQALMGYAIINGTLPCPIDPTVVDPANPNYGSAAATCSANAAVEGYLPWKTLGVSETDAWGSRRTSAGDPWTGYWRYRIDRNFVTSITLNTGFGTCPGADCLSVLDSTGSSLTNTTERPVAIIYSTGPNFTADGQNNSYEAVNGAYQSDVPNPNYDDILIWISRPQLFNRMVTAGKLP